MKSLEDRLLRRMLSFCEENALLSSHRIEENRVYFFVGPDPHSLSTDDARRYLVQLLEEANLSDQFLEILRRSKDDRQGRRGVD